MYPQINTDYFCDPDSYRDWSANICGKKFKLSYYLFPEKFSPNPLLPTYLKAVPGREG